MHIQKVTKQWGQSYVIKAPGDYVHPAAQLLFCIHTLLPSSQCSSLPLHFWAPATGLCFNWLHIRRRDGVPFLYHRRSHTCPSASQVSAVAMRTCSHGDRWLLQPDSRVRCVGGTWTTGLSGEAVPSPPIPVRSTEPWRPKAYGSKDRYLVLKPGLGDGCYAAMSNWYRRSNDHRGGAVVPECSLSRLPSKLSEHSSHSKQEHLYLR